MNRCSLVFAALITLGLTSPGCKKSEDSRSQPAKAAAQQTARPSGPVELKLKWPVGSRVVQRMDVVQTSETLMPRMPKPMKQDMTMGQEFALSVLKARESGGCELEMEFLGNQMLVTMGERTLINFDSHGETTDDSANPMASIFRNMVGARIKYLLDASNRVEKVEGLEEFRKRVITGAPKEAASILNSIFTEDYFKQMVDHAQSLPPGPVNPGDTWPVQMEVALGPLGTMVLDLKYTFKGWENRQNRNCALLEYTGTVQSKAGGSPGPLGMKISIEDGKSSGQNWFDPEAGMFIESAINQNMKMLMTMPNMPGGRTNVISQPQTLTNQMSQKITIKIEEAGSGTK